MVKIEILKNPSLLFVRDKIDYISYEINYKNYRSLIRTYENIDGMIERNDFIIITHGNIHKKWGM